MKARINEARQRDEVTPEDYRVVFESPIGAKVLEHLVSRFAGAVYVRGGQEGERETCFRLGARSAIDFVLNQINRANGVESTEEE